MNRSSAAGSPGLRSARSATRLLRPSLWIAALLAVFTLAFRPLHATQLVPGAYGYGLYRQDNTAGFGTGSTIYIVSDFTDGPTAGSTPGTLRYAITRTGRRIILFNRSGLINLTSDLKITSGDVTIAGQSAPAPGVALHGGSFRVEANNVLVQHLRIRPGDSWLGSLTHDRDAANMSRGNGTIVENVAFDHCTFMWSLDELVSGYWDYSNISFNKCIFAEPLHRSIHVDEGFFDGHLPTPAQNLTRRTGSAGVQTVTSASVAVGSNYQQVNTAATGQFVEYDLVIKSKTSARNSCHIVVAGITGSDRGRFRIEVRDGSGTVVVNDSSQVFDMRVPSSASAQTYAVRTDLFDIPAVASTTTTPTVTYRVKLIITGTSGTGYKLGVDHVSIAQGHGFGPLFSSGQSGNGKISFTNNIFTSMVGRAPWVASKHAVITNNIMYNRGQVFVQLGHSSFTDDVPFYATILGNSFIEGPAWTSYSTPAIREDFFHSGSRVYIASPANYYDRAGITTGHVNLLDDDITPYSSDPNTSTYVDGMQGFSVATAAASRPAVLASAGAHPASRDAVESRLITEINSAPSSSTPLSSRLGSIKDTTVQAGINSLSYPNNPATWSSYPSDPHGMNGSYTNIEHWLHQLAAVAEGTATGPVAPGSFTAAPSSFNAMGLSWSLPSGTIDGFKIERRKGTSGTYTLIATVGPTVTSYPDANLATGTLYQYQIRSYVGSTHSGYVGTSGTTNEVSNRVAHWKLNATSGTSAADETAANNGTFVSTPAWIAGRIGNGVDFNSAADAITAGHGLDNLTAITVSAWIRFDTQGGGSTGRIIHKGDAGGSTAGWRFLLVGSGALQFAVDHATADLAVTSVGGVLTAGTWYHVLATWDGTTSGTSIKLYINGTQTSYAAPNLPSGARNTDAAMIIHLGNDSAGTRGFDGILDDVRVYDRVITTAERDAIRSVGL